VGLLEEVTTTAELLGVLLGHTVGLGCIGLRSSEGEVISLKFTGEVHESLNDLLLNIASLLERVARGKSESLEGSSGSASGGADVLAGGVNLSGRKFGDVHVGGVNGVSGIASVSERDDGVHDLLEHSPGLFISSNETTGLDHGVTLVVHTGLDAVTEVNSKSGFHILVLGVELRFLAQNVGEETLVL